MKKILKKIEYNDGIAWGFLATFFGVYCFAVFGKYRQWALSVITSVLLVSVALVCFVAAYSDLLRDGKRYTKEHETTFACAVGLFFVVGLSLTFYALRYFLDGSVKYGFVALFIAFSCFACVFAQAFCCKALWLDRIKKSERKKRWKVLGAVLAVLVVFGAVYASICSTWARWDSYNYFYYIDKLSVSSLADLESLRIADHSAYALSFIYILLNGFFNNMLYTAYFTNAAVAFLGAVCFYRIVRRLFPTWKGYSCAACAAVYFFSPYVFGIVQFINLDSFLLFGLLFFLAADAAENRFLRVASCVFLCFTKETGPVLLAALMVVRLLRIYFQHRKEKFNLKNFELAFTVPVLICGVIWLVDTLLNSWSASNKGNLQFVDGNVFNGFGIDFTFLADKMQSIFLTNFTWVFVLVGVLAGICLLLDLKSGRVKKRKFTLVEMQIFTALVVSFLLDILFVTYNHVRYNLVFVAFLYLVTVWLVGKVKLKTAVNVAMTSIACALFFAQCFYTVDPMMYLSMVKIDCGNGYLTATRNGVFIEYNLENRKQLDFCDNIAYNRQTIYFDRALDELIAKSDYEKGATCYVFTNEYFTPSIHGVTNCDYLFMGNGYKYLPEPRYVSWDGEKDRRYIAKHGGNEIPFFYVLEEEELQACLDAYETVYYIKLPFGDEYFRRNVLLGRSAEKVCEASSNIWKLELYKING